MEYDSEYGTYSGTVKLIAGWRFPGLVYIKYDAGTNGGCYPSNYYTMPQYPASGYPSGGYPAYPAQTQNGFYDSTGKFYPYVKDANGQLGYYDNNGQFVPLNNSGKNNNPNVNGNPANGFYDNNGVFHPYVQDANGQLGYYDNNGQFVPLNNNVQNPQPQPDGTAQNGETVSETSSNQTVTDTETKSEESSDDKKTEKKKVVVLTDDYIKSLENYLNSQDLEVRKIGAHDVVDRLEEDPSRKENAALTALVNKMLKDPSSIIRAIALSTIEAGLLAGNDETVSILKEMQKSKDEYGLDATQATSALLKMAQKTEEREVEVREKKKSKPEKGDNK